MMCYNRNMIKKAMILFVCVLLSCLALPVSALSETQEATIVKKCDSIQEKLKLVQKKDARVRVYLGALYEKILTKYIVPLNVRLVENSVTNVSLIENQNSFAEARIDFYQKLEQVRTKREKMTKDVAELSELLTKQKSLVSELKGSL